MSIQLSTRVMHIKDQTTGSYDSVDILKGSGVDDVQINGTSIVSDGVANVPIASSSAPGVVTINTTRGLRMIDNDIATSGAGPSGVKAGSNAYNPITPEIQHASAFYGLAKAAGSDEKNSSLAVGQYTDAAKVAIQKMLGIYEPPWELLNDITLDAEGPIDLTADSNGTPYNLLGVYISVYYDSNLQNASGYGRYRLYDSNGNYCNAETGAYITGGPKYKLLFLDRRNNLSFFNYVKQRTIGDDNPWTIKSPNGYGVTINLGNIVRIAMPSPDVEPAGTRIQIYGQRAY